MTAGYTTTRADHAQGIHRAWRRLIVLFGEPRDSYGRVPVEIGESISDLIYWGEKTGPRTDIMLCGQMTGRALAFFYSGASYEAIREELLLMAREASLDLEFKA